MRKKRTKTLDFLHFVQRETGRGEEERDRERERSDYVEKEMEKEGGVRERQE